MFRKGLVILKLIENCRLYSSSSAKSKVRNLIVKNTTYVADDCTNLTPRIQSYVGQNVYQHKNHPLSITQKLIITYIKKWLSSNQDNLTFDVLNNLSPIVASEQKLDHLLCDNLNRKNPERIYLNCEYMLRPHNAVHYLDALQSGMKNFVVCGDVYRRHDADATDFPVVHQLDLVRTIHRDKLPTNGADYEPNQSTSTESPAIEQQWHALEAIKRADNELQTAQVGLVQHLFGADVKYRWVDARLPFTQPSSTLEVWHNGTWTEVIQSGFLRNEIFEASDIKNTVGWTFGIGLEQLAMILFDIPNIRLFWSKDLAFLRQFDNSKSIAHMQYKSISMFGQRKRFISFWLPNNFTLDSFPVDNFYAMVREIGGEHVEQIKFLDKFQHPKEKKNSFSFCIVYRHMKKELTKNFVNGLHTQIEAGATKKFNVNIRINKKMS